MRVNRRQRVTSRAGSGTSPAFAFDDRSTSRRKPILYGSTQPISSPRGKRPRRGHGPLFTREKKCRGQHQDDGAGSIGGCRYRPRALPHTEEYRRGRRAWQRPPLPQLADILKTKPSGVFS